MKLHINDDFKEFQIISVLATNNGHILELHKASPERMSGETRAGSNAEVKASLLFLYLSIRVLYNLSGAKQNGSLLAAITEASVKD